MNDLVRDPLKDWAEARSLSNGLYSLYKGYRDREQACESVVMERMRDKLALTEDQLIKTTRRIKELIDEGAEL